MPLGESPADSKPKTPLKKAISFISPLLIVSALFHGLAMLLPVPEKSEIVEETLDLPEAIQVSELPELQIVEPELESAPVFVPALVPESPPVVAPPVPVVQQPVIVPPAPVVQPAPVAAQPIDPQVTTPDSTVQNPGEKKDPVGKDPIEPVGSSSVVRAYKEVGTGRDTTLSITVVSALSSGVYSSGTPITYKPIDKGTLTISVPAGDNCFSKGTPVAGTDSVMLPASLFVIVSRNEEGEGYVQAVEVGSSTGYDEANDLISFDLPDEAFDPIYQWLKEQVGGTFPFDTQGEYLAYLVFNVEAVYENHSCPP